jgi:hypothetical protein
MLRTPFNGGRGVINYGILCDFINTSSSYLKCKNFWFSEREIKCCNASIQVTFFLT